jgi:DNA repair ATPase RecN
MENIAPMQKAAEESAQKSQEANAKLGEACGSDPNLADTCQKVMTILSSLPSDPTQINAANEKIAELKAISTDNEALKTAIENVAGHLETMVKSTAEFMALQGKLEEVAKKAESATSKEAPIIEGLNSYCQAP